MRATLLIFLAACTPGPKQFAPSIHRTFCAAFETCNPDAFTSRYESVSECAADYTATNGDGSCFARHCVYDREAAGECLTQIEEADCATLDRAGAEAACAAVWSDCDQDAIEDCLEG